MRAARLAFAFRQTFHKDVVIDLVCYRKHGHNEGDDPSYTQPLMYQRIEAKRSVRKLYTETLVRRGDITLEEAESALDDFNAKLQAVLDEVRQEPSLAPTELPVPDAGPVAIPTVETGVAPDVLRALSAVVRSVPEGFTVHPKLERQFAQRDELVAGGHVDWALAEALAIGSLMYEGVNVRLTGQDTRRGTFSHRHAVLVDYANGEEYVPLAHIRDGLHRIGADQLEPAGEMGNFTVRDSLLSEYAAVGFEYGYSVEAPEALVAWEAQFGDFVNGAQIIIDNFLVAAENKWAQYAGLVAAPAARVRGPGTRALLVPVRAVPLAVRPGQHAGHHPLHVGPVLPPAALPGADDAQAASRSSSRPSRCCGRTPRARPSPISRRDPSARSSTTSRSRTPPPSVASCCAAARSATRPSSGAPSSRATRPLGSPSSGWSRSTRGRWSC